MSELATILAEITTAIRPQRVTEILPLAEDCRALADEVRKERGE